MEKLERLARVMSGREAIMKMERDRPMTALSPRDVISDKDLDRITAKALGWTIDRRYPSIAYPPGETRLNAPIPPFSAADLTHIGPVLVALRTVPGFAIENHTAVQGHRR